MDKAICMKGFYAVCCDSSGPTPMYIKEGDELALEKAHVETGRAVLRRGSTRVYTSCSTLYKHFIILKDEE